MKKIQFLLPMLVVTASSACAQNLWTSAEMKIGIAKGLSAAVGGENRTTDGVDGIERWSASAGLGYKPCSWLKLAADYTYIYQHTDSRTTKKGNVISDYWQPRHRISFSLTGSYEWNSLTFSLRERYQYTHYTSMSVAKYDGDDGTQKADEQIEAKDKNTLRSRLQIDYNIRKTGFTPFVSAEFYNDLSDGLAKEKTRWTVGTDYKINKRNTVSLYYRYIDRTDDDDAGSHIIGVGYQFKL